jgi:hypothetical protein
MYNISKWTHNDEAYNSIFICEYLHKRPNECEDIDKAHHSHSFISTMPVQAKAAVLAIYSSRTSTHPLRLIVRFGEEDT